ncbi:MAG: hypothetical protein ACI82F_004533 [Planctomycetota bacterium]|jgi:hypothetical protein
MKKSNLQSGGGGTKKAEPTKTCGAQGPQRKGATQRTGGTRTRGMQSGKQAR